jgi:hypothetical protein
MTAIGNQASPKARRALLAVAFLALCGFLVAVGAASRPAGAAQAKQLGKTKKTPKPNCPTANVPNPPLSKQCTVLGRVTGFQVRGDGKKNLFKMPTKGTIVAWSVDVAHPNKSERENLGRLLGNDKLGADAYAQLSILNPQGNAHYKLLKKSPRMKLNPFFGTRPVFTLNDPLFAKKGRIIALTTPTWAPTLAAGKGPKSDRWRASRRSDRCSGQDNLLKSKAQQKLKSSRKYGCVYTDRLTYWAYYLPR